MKSHLLVDGCADPSLDRIIRTCLEIEKSPEDFAQYTFSTRFWDPRYPEGLIPLYRDAWPNQGLEATTFTEPQVYSRFSYVGERAIHHITLPTQTIFDEFDARECVKRVESRARDVMLGSTELGIRFRSAALKRTGGFLGAIIIRGEPGDKAAITEVIYPKTFRQVAALYFKETEATDHASIEEAKRYYENEDDIPEYIIEYEDMLKKFASSDSRELENACNQVVLGVLFNPYVDQH